MQQRRRIAGALERAAAAEGRLMYRRELGGLLPRRAGSEKALRAIVVWLGIDFPRTHVLERIADLLLPEISTTLDRDALIEVSPGRDRG